jgi:hypothetical protein
MQLLVTMKITSKVFMAVNMLGMIAYLLLENSLINRSSDVYGEANGFDYLFLWMTRELSILVFFSLVNCYWLISFLWDSTLIDRERFWASWLLVCLAWVGTITFRGTSLEAVRVIFWS